MVQPATNLDAVIAVVHDRIAELENDLQSLVHPQKAESFALARFHKQPHGVVSDGNGSKNAKVFRIVGEFVEGRLGPYGDQEYTYSTTGATVSTYSFANCHALIQLYRNGPFRSRRCASPSVRRGRSTLQRTIGRSSASSVRT